MFISLYQSMEVRSLKELGTEQMSQTLLVSISMALYCQKHMFIYHIFRRAFVDKKPMAGYVNEASYIQKALDKKIVKSPLFRGCFNQHQLRCKFPSVRSCLRSIAVQRTCFHSSYLHGWEAHRLCCPL